MEHPKSHAGDPGEGGSRSGSGGSGGGVGGGGSPDVAQSLRENKTSVAPVVKRLEAGAVPASSTAGSTSTISNNSSSGHNRSGSRRTMSWRRHSQQLGGSNRMESRRRSSSSTAMDDEVGNGGGGGARRGRGSTQEFEARVPGTGGSGGGDLIPFGDLDDPEVVNHNYEDVREELELSGHNLTSVLNNPRETFMDSLYEAAFETEQHPPLEAVVVPTPSTREVTIQVNRQYSIQTAIVPCTQQA